VAALSSRQFTVFFQGHGIEGLKLLQEAANKYNLLVISEVMEIAQIEPMLPYIDIFQIGARNMQELQPAAANWEGEEARSAQARHRRHAGRVAALR